MKKISFSRTLMCLSMK